MKTESQVIKELESKCETMGVNYKDVLKWLELEEHEEEEIEAAMKLDDFNDLISLVRDVNNTSICF